MPFFDAFLPIWNGLLVGPIEGSLITLAEATGSAGLAIILFTIVVRTVLLPLGIMQAKSQKAMFALQPQIKELQKKYGSDRQKMSQEQMRLYRESGVNPLAGCLPMALQMPIWFALYSALITLANDFPLFQQSFLWVENLALPSMPGPDPRTWPLVILPILTAATQFVVQKMSTMPSADPQQQQMNQMMQFMPLMFLVFSFQVASGLTLYWVISNIYSIVQQYFTVGWGSMPFLGAKIVPVTPEPSPKDQRNGPAGSDSPRRKGPGQPPRRKRGK
jgi:YidC/Oxa1 family membrane protein insertase